MRVALELQPCCGDRSGIGTYTYELARRLKSGGGLEFSGNVFNFLNKTDTRASLEGIDMPVHVQRSMPYGVYRRIWHYAPLTYGMLFPPADLNVNKVESGVRLRYQYKDPYTGEEEEILIENTETRDQPKNKENAMRQLRSILYDKELQHRMEEQAKVEAGKKKIEWGSQIRSYVFDDRRVKDHRTNFQTSDVNGVMDGKIDGFIKAYLMEFSGSEN